MRALTPRQEQILSLIRSEIEATGMPPTRAEIALKLGFKSANAAEEHLRALARKGAIEMLPGTSRGIRLLQEDESDEELGLPLIGKVAAGAPILAAEHVQERLAVDPAMFHPAADFLLRVQGDSMQDIGILDGDLLAVHRTAEARNGQVVVARVGDDEVTVKRLQQRGHLVELIAENANYAPIRVDLTQTSLSIEGLAVGVIRRGNLA
jgi:repressor LexA